MKLAILCALFIPIIYLAIRQKKWYLYLLVAFIGVLPEQFSIKLHENLPLLTATRILILVVLGFWLYDKWKTKQFRFPKSLLLFLAVNIIISLINLRYGAADIKRIFLLIFERALLVVMITDMICDQEEFFRCIDFAIMGCAALAVIGIVQTVFDYDISSVLHLTETITSVHIADRMGLTRAFGTYNAISYGCYCAFMTLLILYRLYHTKSIWHSIAFSLNFVALICTFTRSAWLCLAAILFVVLVIYRTKLIRRLLASIGIIIVLCGILCCFQPKLFDAFVETGKSSINTVLGIIPDRVISMFVPDNGQDPAFPEDSENSESPSDPDDHRPGFDLDEDFGANRDNPTYSRTAQWTAVQYMTQEGELLFGYGYNALPRGRIHFFYDRWGATWTQVNYLDVGLVALLAESGLIGAVSYLGLLSYLLVEAFRKRNRKEKFDYNSLTLFMIPLYLLLNILAAFLHAGVVWLFIGLFYAYQKNGVGTLPDHAIYTPNLPHDCPSEKNANAVTVSIYVPTFNHEDYITQALDSILMQQTQYSYEVYIGEDCSTDNTRQVLKAWEAAHPDPQFHFFYRQQNMHKSAITNAADLKQRCTGKYIICLEGDDFWTDPNKLESQVSFLETHPEYYAVAHNCTVVSKDSSPSGEKYPECKDTEYSLRHFASDILPGQMATLLARNYMIDPEFDRTLIDTPQGPGDRRIFFSLLCHGSIYCLQKTMSAYRHILTEGSSFSATRKYSYHTELANSRVILEYAYQLENKEAIRCAEMLYLRTIRHALRNSHVSQQTARQDTRILRHKLRTTALLLKRDINYRIFHKTLHI